MNFVNTSNSVIILHYDIMLGSTILLILSVLHKNQMIYAFAQNGGFDFSKPPFLHLIIIQIHVLEYYY